MKNVFIISVFILFLSSCSEYKEDPVLRSKIDSAWINTSFQNDPELCSDLDFYYTVIENLDNGNDKQNKNDLDSIVKILKVKLK